MSQHDPIDDPLDSLLRSSLKAREVSVPEGFCARMLAAVRRREYQAAVDQVARHERRLTVACILAPLALAVVFRIFPDLASIIAAASRNMVEALPRVASRVPSAGIESPYLLVVAAILVAVGYAVYDRVFQNSA